MCRENFIFLLLYLAVTIAAGAYLGSIVLSLFVFPAFWLAVFIYFVCIAVVALFLLPVLDKLTY